MTETLQAIPAQELLPLLIAIDGPRELDAANPLEQFFLLLLAQSGGATAAQPALQRLKRDFVDWNEARVSTSHEIAMSLAPFGSEAERSAVALSLKEVLAHIYLKFNKLALDFMLPEARAAEDQKKRERFGAWIAERWPALTSLFELSLAQKQRVATLPGLARVLQRIGWLGDKTSQTAVREALGSRLPEGELVRAQWALCFIAERHCHPRQPACQDCPLRSLCPSAVLTKALEAEAVSEHPAADSEGEAESETATPEPKPAKGKPGASAKKAAKSAPASGAPRAKKAARAPKAAPEGAERGAKARPTKRKASDRKSVQSVAEASAPREEAAEPGADRSGAKKKRVAAPRPPAGGASGPRKKGKTTTASKRKATKKAPRKSEATKSAEPRTKAARKSRPAKPTKGKSPAAE